MTYYNGVDIIAAFEKAMHEAGIVPEFTRGGGIVSDGKLQRFHVKGDKKGTRNGWCVLFGDGVPAGEFGSWKTGDTVSWCAKESGSITPDEQREIKARIAAARAEREREERERQGEAARLANLLWNDAVDLDDDAHPYLERKGVRSHGLRVAAWPVRNSAGEVFRYIENTLVIPIYDIRGKIVSLQGVFPKTDAAFGRDKDFLVGGKKRGCFFMIGKPQAGQPVAICEGYATGATIHQATGWCVIVAWDAYNLPHVAKVFRAEMPDTLFVIAADNDQFTKPTPENPNVVENPGITYARMAVAAIGARLVWPEFADLDGEPTDFNDLAQREGMEVVQAQVFPPLPTPAPASVPAPAAGTAVAVQGFHTADILLNFDTARPFPEIDGKGNPLPTAHNLNELCRRTGVIVRYDVIRKAHEILAPGVATSRDNFKSVSDTALKNCLPRARMSTAGYEENLLAVADANQYNPVTTWINSKPWDGVSRLQAMFDTITAKNDPTLPDGRSLKEVLMRRWLISCIAAAYLPNGVSARGVLTLVAKQGVGKTQWVKSLAPEELNVIQDAVTLNPADKDTVLKAIKNWIVELGEVDATFRKADIAALKSFLTSNVDTVRRPYGRSEAEYVRRTIFFASVNDEQFLHDPTGNTRWWTVHAEAVNWRHGIDMQQLWAEVKTLFDSGETWHLSAEEAEVLNGHNREHEAISPVHDMIDRAFDWSIAPSLWNNALRATEIALSAGIDKPTKKDVNEAAAYVSDRHHVTTKKVGKDRTKVWMMPPRVARSGQPERPF